jgi:adenylate kinase family enzyme
VKLLSLSLLSGSVLIWIARTEVGREAEDIVAQGGLLPDEMVLKVVTSKLDKLNNKVCLRCFVIDCSVTYYIFL